MLQFFRKLAGSLPAKILFVVLLASFGVWGIGDFLRQRPQDTTVIRVGDRNIAGDQLQQAVQRTLQRFRGISLEQARALGLVQQTVESEIARALFDQEAARQGIVVGPQQIVAAVQHEKAFLAPNGQFDRTTFLNALAANNMTEGQYEAMLRGDLPRSLALSPAMSGAAAPAALVDLLYRIRNEQRVALWVHLPNADAKDIPAPDDAALHDYYDKHHAAFTAPEYRGFTALVLQPSDVADEVKITDAQLHDAYQQRVDEFTQPERRHVLQMLLPDEKAANDAKQQVAGGKDFAAIAKDVAKQDASTTDLGTVSKAELPPEIADAAFAANAGDLAGPVKGPFGWAVLKVTEVKPGGVKSFEEAKPEIEAALRKEKEGEALYELSNKVQDALSAGADLGQIAQQFKLKPVTIAAADSAGKAPDATPVPGFGAPMDTVMKTVFATGQGQVSALEQVSDTGPYYVVKVDKITPAALKPFDEVKDQVKDAWLADARAAKVAEHAKKLADAVKPDAPLDKVAAAQKLQVVTGVPFTRSNARTEAPLPPALVTKLFEIKPGEVATAAGPDGQYVAQLKEVKPADPAADKAAVDQLSKQLTQNIGQDLVEEFEAALKQRYPVEIRQAAIDKLFPASTTE